MQKLATAIKLFRVGKKFAQRQDGPTMIEYALLVALIALVVIAVTKLIGIQLSGVFNSVSTSLAADI